ncbi:ATP-binding cassette domain-containing protein, partial [Streptomyces sp. NPDC001940]
MSDFVIEAAGLRKEFGQAVAVDDVSFTLSRGQSLAVVGESGSGKTTVARMLVGLENPSGGSISVCGRPRRGGRVSSAERRRRAREIQIVFQDPYSSLDKLQRIGDVVAPVTSGSGPRPRLPLEHHAPDPARPRLLPRGHRTRWRPA